MAKREFGEGIFLSICQFIIKIFLFNCYFVFCNLLILFYYVTYGFELTPQSKYIFLLTFIPLGPALTALYASMEKLRSEKDISSLYYWRMYRLNFKQAIKAWLIMLAFIMIFYIDILYFKERSYGVFFIPFFQVLIALLVLSSFYVFPIISRFHLKTVDVYKLSLYFIFSFYKATLFFIALILLGSTIAMKFPAYTFPFIFSLFSYIVMFALSSVFIKTGKRLTQSI